MCASRTKKYIPTWKGEIEGWVVNHLNANVWRVARTMDYSDCMQEAYEVFARVAQTYPGVDAPHFMALFKTSWTRAFHNLSISDTRQRAREVALTDKQRAAVDASLVGETNNDGELQVMLRQAPREVKMVLNLMLRAPQEILDIAFAGMTRDKRYRAGGSERINAMLGLPLQQDTLQQVHDYFSK